MGLVRHKLLIFQAICFTLAAVFSSQDIFCQEIASTDVTVGALFREVEDRYASIEAMSFTVKRTLTGRRQRREEQWRFKFKRPEKIRIDYDLPYERVIISDGSHLLEYIPEAKKAVKTDLITLSPEKREQTIASVIGRVSVDGLHLGNYKEMEKRVSGVRAVTWAGADAYMVEGENPRYVVYIDRKLGVLLRTELFDKKGKMIIRTESSRFVKAAENIWLPQQVIVSYSTAEGPLQSKLLLQDIKVNKDIPDDVFVFHPSTDVEIVTN